MPPSTCHRQRAYRLADPGAIPCCVRLTCKTNRQPTQTHPFNGPLSGTTRVSRYQKGKTSLDSTEARDSEWQWHQLLGRVQVCTSLQTDDHASTPPHHSLFYTPDALPAVQPTASKHRRQATDLQPVSSCRTVH